MSTNVFAAENLSENNGWNGNVYQGDQQRSFSFNLPDDNTIEINANGNYGQAYAQWEKGLDDPIGMIADITINDTAGNGDKMIGIRGNIGTWGDTTFLAEIRVSEWQNKQRCISYRVRERDKDFNNVRIWANGYIGNFKNEWEYGDKISLGFAKVGSEIWFYASGYKSQMNTKDGNYFLKIAPFPTNVSKSMGLIENPYYAINAYAEKNGEVIEGKIENVYVIY